MIDAVAFPLPAGFPAPRGRADERRARARALRAARDELVGDDDRLHRARPACVAALPDPHLGHEIERRDRLRGVVIDRLLGGGDIDELRRARIDREAFVTALSLGGEEAARTLLEEKTGGAPFHAALARGTRLEELETAALSSMIRAEREAIRRDTTTTAALISFVLSLRAHLWDLGRVVWAAALGAKLRGRSWVTP